MGQHTIVVEGDSVKDAKIRLRGQIPEGLFLVSQEVLSDGNVKSIESKADTTADAYSKAESGMPAGYEVTKREVLQQPGKRVLRLHCDSHQVARDQARQACQDRGNVLDVRLAATGKKGFLSIGRTPNQYEAEVMDLAVVRITGERKARVRGILDDHAPLEFLYAEEQKYYPVAPVEVMVILCDANFPKAMWKMFGERVVDLAQLVPCGEVLKNCDFTYHTASSDKNAMEKVLSEAVARNLNAAIYGIFEGSALAARFSFLLGVLTTIPPGKKSHITNAGGAAVAVLKPRDP
jgi:hypothetical protein